MAAWYHPVHVSGAQIKDDPDDISFHLAGIKALVMAQYDDTYNGINLLSSKQYAPPGRKQMLSIEIC